MKIYMNVIIALVLTLRCASARAQREQDNQLIFPQEAASDIPISPRLSHYAAIRAGDKPDHYPDQTHVRFEDDPPRPPDKAADINTNEPLQGNTKRKVIFEDDQNGHRILAPVHHLEDIDNNVYDESFQGSLEAYDNGDLNFAHVGDTSINGDEIPGDNSDDDSLEENENDDKNSLELKEQNKRNKTGRVAFQDNKRDIQKPLQKTKRRRKPRVQFSQNAAHDPTSNYPGYPGPIHPENLKKYPYSYYPNSPTSYPKGYPPYSSGYPGYTPYPGPNRPLTQAQNTKGPIHPSYSKPESSPSGKPENNKPVAYPGQENQGSYPGSPGPAGYQAGYGYINPTGQYRPYPGPQGYYGPPYRTQSLTQRAISAVSEALTSIAKFDDKHCVPRLLCEVASGSTGTSPTLLKATTGLAPLLTVLQSYNGASSSPLFLFGRAAVLGMTTKGNPTSCRYAYPQCPNTPEGLINYLNNHNGGFFRFFGQPEGQQQNLEQFYNHLAGGQQSQSQQQTQQTYPQQNPPYYGYPHGYGFYNPYYRPTSHRREQNTYRNTKELDSEVASSGIQERIQNKPIPDADDLDEEESSQGSKWTFPEKEEIYNKRDERPKRQRKERARRPRPPIRQDRNERGGAKLKFPDENGPKDQDDFDTNRDLIRKQKGIYFPNGNHYNFYNKYQSLTPVNSEEYVFDYKHNFFVKRPQAVKDDVETVYIVRGNGDPNHPEIVKVRPGQSVS